MRVSLYIVLFLMIARLSPLCAQNETVTSDSLKQKMPVIEYKFQPKHLILPASLITVGAVGTAIDGMNDFHLFSRKSEVKKIHVTITWNGECWAGYSFAT